MSKTITVTCPRIDDNGECDAELEIPIEWERGEMWGQDADGNRGMWIPGRYTYFFDEVACPNGHKFTAEEIEKIENAADQACDDYEQAEADAYFDRNVD